MVLPTLNSFCILDSLCLFNMETPATLAVISAAAMLVAATVVGCFVARSRALYVTLAFFAALAVTIHVKLTFPGLVPSMLNMLKGTVGPPPNLQVGCTAPFWSGYATSQCLQRIHEVQWSSSSSGNSPTSKNPPGVLPDGAPGRALVAGDASPGEDRVWQWEESLRQQCGFRVFEREEALGKLQDTWIVVAGDSQARLFLVALLRLLLPSLEPIQALVYKRHSNFHHEISRAGPTPSSPFPFPSSSSPTRAGIRIDFLWNPYSWNITESVLQLARRRGGDACPDVLVTSAGLWHMLWATDDEQERAALHMLSDSLRELRCVKPTPEKATPPAVQGRELSKPEENRPVGTGASRNDAESLARSRSGFSDGRQEGRETALGGRQEGQLDDRRLLTEQSQTPCQPAVFWLTLPTLVNARLNTDRKREVLTDQVSAEYARALAASELLLPKGPAFGVDLKGLSRGCGQECTSDGMHYNNATYDAAVQVVLNAYVSAPGPA
eukprot:jgi/Mesen1/5324/ME000266S04512